MSSFDERNRHSKVFRGHKQRVAYCRLTSVVSIRRVFRGHSLRVAYRRSSSTIAIQKFSEVFLSSKYLQFDRKRVT